MIEKLVQQFETELMTQETTETADETTDNVETTESEMDNVDESETDETRQPVSLVASIVEQLEKELMTDKDEPADDEPSESVEQGGQDVSDETESGQDDEPSADESEPTDDVPADEDKPTEDVSESVETDDEPNDQLTELMNELQTKSESLDKERTELLERVEEAEQRAEQSERQMKRLVLSHALANRDDIVDGRLIAELVDVESIELAEDETIELAVTNRINEVVKKYSSVLAKEKGAEYVARNVEGITTYEKVKSIGRATAKAQEEPFNSKQELLEEARQRAEKGGQKERVAYLALRRKYGL